MTFFSDSIPQNLGLIFIAAGAIAFYIAARIAVDSLTNFTHPSPARLAMAHWIPVASVGITSVIVGLPVIGVCVAFGASVAALTLNLGLITATTGEEVGAGEFSRAWPFLIPAALIAFVAGFSARLNWQHAIMLAIEAAMIAVVWFVPTRRARAKGGFPVIQVITDAHPTASPMPNGPIEAAPVADVSRDPLTPRRWLTLVLSVVVAAGAAIVSVFGAWRMSEEVPLTTPGLIGAVGLSPLLLLPMIGTGTMLAERRHATAVATGLIGLTLMNLCVLLPLMIVIWIGRCLIMRQENAPLHLPFPIASWRVDTVLILIVAALLIPVALGRWRLGRTEGVVLIITYAAYLATTSVLAMRW